jgi:hypothetical protein
MPFFDEPEPRKPRKRSRKLRRDEHQRPKLILPGYLGEDVVLATSDEAAVLMHGLACYPTGFAFTLQVTTRYEVSYDDDDEWDIEPFGLWGHRRPRENAGRFGIEYSDGRRVTLDRHRYARARSEDAPLVIAPGGGGGGGGNYSTEVWVEPLPPPGLVTFAVEWTATGIAETLHTIEGGLFREAAKRSKPVFPPRGRKPS